MSVIQPSTIRLTGRFIRAYYWSTPLFLGLSLVYGLDLRVPFLETIPGELPSRGRVHFVSDETTRATGWIFVEVSEQEVLRRFQEFSAVELWKLLESLG